MAARLSALAALLCAAAAAAQNPISVTVADDGSYTVSVGAFASFASGDTGVMINGQWVSKALGSLTPTAPTAGSGADAWGAYTSTEQVWSAAGAEVLRTRVRTYAAVPAVIFEQLFPAEVQTGATEAGKDGLISSFPSFSTPTSSSLGWMEYRGPFIDDGTRGPGFGQWSPSSLGANFNGGLTGGPVVFFDANGTEALVFSPASDFMAGSLVATAGGQELRTGLMGSASSIPAWHSHESVLFYGAGPNAAVMAWGSALLVKFGKADNAQQLDFTATHLAYNTDHGAFYYYTTGNYSNYSEALLAVYNYSLAVGIPYKAILLDSWWYFKGIGGGVKNWTARPDVFTDGPAGMRALQEQTNWKIIAHNRYWSADTDYAKQNGGDWDFFIDAPKSPAGGQMALPLDAGFWEFLLTDAVTGWGLATYEQDWLFNELQGVDALLTNLTLGRQWLLEMGMGADAAGVSIQLCMPFPRHVLQSVEIPSVTQVRASDDHVPCEGYYPLQWRIGYSSLFAWSVAVAPFKDNAWSTSFQPGGSCGNALEVSPGLHLAISVFSAGPVTPADGVGYSDVNQIMRTCTAGGMLLHPSRAATAIDMQIVGRVFPSAEGATGGEVYATYSLVSGLVFDHVITGDLNTSYNLLPSALVGIRADIPVRYGGRSTGGHAHLALTHGEQDRAAGFEAAAAWVAYTLNTSNLDPASLTVQPFSPASPIPLRACKEVDFQVWHTAPVFSNGWALLGELTKWVPTSAVRLVSVSSSDTDVVVEVKGEAGEAVPLTFYNTATGAPATVQCTLADNGRARAVMPAAVCQ